jgi:hypothetical protein
MISFHGDRLPGIAAGEQTGLAGRLLYAYSLQSPIDASFPASAADPSGDQLKRLLETILEPLEEGQHPARGDAQ